MGPRISHLLDPSRVVLDLEGTRRTTAIHEVALALEGAPGMVDFPAFYAELLARERLDSTCIGHEVALPHARTEHATEILLAAGRRREGVTFENGNQTVRLIFVLATPKARAADYLLVVGALCRLLKDPAVREGLLAAATPEAFVAVFAAAEAG